MKVSKYLRVIAFLALGTLAFAQSKPQSNAEQAFAKMKTLAGAWHGKVTIEPKMDYMDSINVTMRVTSRGNAIVHEMKGNTPDDPITMIYLNQGRLMLTHYCDAGNRPRMTATLSPDGKKIDFSFLDISGPAGHGHMEHALFTMVDANHHTEDWTFALPGDQAVHAHFDLQRNLSSPDTSGKAGN